MIQKMSDNIDILNLSAQLADRYPPKVRSQLTVAHENLISQFISDKPDELNYDIKRDIVQAINCISYMFISGDTIPKRWNIQDPRHTFSLVDDDNLRRVLLPCRLYITTKMVDWMALSSAPDIHVLDISSQLTSTSAVSASKVKVYSPDTSSHSSTTSVGLDTDKSDLYIQCPMIPQFDTRSVWRSCYMDGSRYVIYMSYPIVPTKQNEISVTTDVNVISNDSLLNLFPNRLIHTRAASMYESYPGLELDPVLGAIIPVEGFTRDEIVDNIIRYPHLFRLMKCIDNDVKSFYTSIEIDGQLHKIADIWSSLPESKTIPYNKDFIKEYVVRRYLLERDIHHVKHRYSMYGTLEPFLTLFTSPEGYQQLGYSNALELAKQCVISRVSFKQSRNPILRRIEANG